MIEMSDYITELIPKIIDTDEGTHLHLIDKERRKIAEAIVDGLRKDKVPADATCAECKFKVRCAPVDNEPCERFKRNTDN